MQGQDSSGTRAPAADVAGRWSFCDDGWVGSLILRSDGDELAGTLHSDRFDETYEVSGRVGGESPGAVALTIHDYNWLDRQEYLGYLMSHGGRCFAGTTDWRGTPYGFFATRSSRLLIGRYREGPATVEDFAGQWVADLDGQSATVTLATTDDGIFVGHAVVHTDGSSFTLTGRQMDDVPHGATVVSPGQAARSAKAWCTWPPDPRASCAAGSVPRATRTAARGSS